MSDRTRPVINVAKKTGSATKSFFSAIGDMAVAAAEASAERSAQIQQHEASMREHDAAIVALGGKSRLAGNNTLPWSTTNPGHLISCPASCSMRHCIDCGSRVSLSSDIRCLACR